MNARANRSSANGALFVDRDGILNHPVWRTIEGKKVLSSPRNWSEVRHFEGIEELSLVRELGFYLILVTNQPDVERGLLSRQFLKELHAYYQQRLFLDEIFVCEFANPKHPKKKPNPGMFLEAAQKFQLALSHCYHLGDTQKDVLAAQRCGCEPILWERDYNADVQVTHRVCSVESVLEILRKRQRSI